MSLGVYTAIPTPDSGVTTPVLESGTYYDRVAVDIPANSLVLVSLSRTTGEESVHAGAVTFTREVYASDFGGAYPYAVYYAYLAEGFTGNLEIQFPAAFFPGPYARFMGYWAGTKRAAPINSANTTLDPASGGATSTPTVDYTTPIAAGNGGYAVIFQYHGDHPIAAPRAGWTLVGNIYDPDAGYGFNLALMVRNSPDTAFGGDVSPYTYQWAAEAEGAGLEIVAAVDSGIPRGVLAALIEMGEL